MTILQSCCYWDNVRQGSFASTIYTLIYFSFSSFIFVQYARDEQDFLFGVSEKPSGESLLERGEVTPTIVIFNVTFLGFSLLLVVSSVLAIVGLRANRRELLVPWITCMIVDILIEIFHLIYLSIMQRVIFDPVVGFVFTIDFFIMCLNLYCLLCVISQYQEYKQGRGYASFELRTANPMPSLPLQSIQKKSLDKHQSHQQTEATENPHRMSHPRHPPHEGNYSEDYDDDADDDGDGEESKAKKNRICRNLGAGIPSLSPKDEIVDVQVDLKRRNEHQPKNEQKHLGIPTIILDTSSIPSFSSV